MLTAGQRHDGVSARPLLERIRVPPIGRGRPRCRPDHVVADKAYASRGFRAYLRKRGISHTIQKSGTSNATAVTGAVTAVARRGSTGRSTVDATPSNAASTGSRTSAASLPDMTRPPPPTKQRSLSRHSFSGQDPFEDGP